MRRVWRGCRRQNEMDQVIVVDRSSNVALENDLSLGASRLLEGHDPGSRYRGATWIVSSFSLRKWTSFSVTMLRHLHLDRVVKLSSALARLHLSAAVEEEKGWSGEGL